MVTGRVLSLRPVVAYHYKACLVVSISGHSELCVWFKIASLEHGMVAIVAYPTISAAIHKSLIRFNASGERC